MIMNTPCALERIAAEVSFSTNSEPEILKKSNATPYRENEHPDARAGVAGAKQCKTQYPCEHGDQHDALDAEPFEKEWDKQNAERFRDLRERDQDRGVFDAEGAEIFGAVDARVAETFDVSVGEGIGDLQRHAQQHGEDEEDGHLALFEEGEGAQPEQIDDRLAASRPVDRAVRQRERVETQYEAQGRREVELGCTQAHLSEIDDPHGTDESDRAPHADGREVGYGIQSCFFEGVVGDRIAKRWQRPKRRCAGIHRSAMIPMTAGINSEAIPIVAKKLPICSPSNFSVLPR